MICEVCEKDLEGNKKYKPKVIQHHIDYEKDITITVCYACHMWLHGQAKVYRHEFKTKYDRARAPYEFAKAVVKAYEKKKKMRRN